jgi:antitoxin (DNA-binding transcriptional repressor) of toxin-antitoxin stability system
VSAKELKARCRQLLDEIQQHGKPIAITKDGIPVAILRAPKQKELKDFRE